MMNVRFLCVFGLGRGRPRSKLGSTVLISDLCSCIFGLMYTGRRYGSSNFSNHERTRELCVYV